MNFAFPHNDPTFLASLIASHSLTNVLVDYHISFNEASLQHSDNPFTGDSLTFDCDPNISGGLRCLSNYINFVWSDISNSQKEADSFKAVTKTFIGDFDIQVALNWSNNYMLKREGNIQVGCCDPVKADDCNFSTVCLPLGADPNFALTKVFLSQFYRLQLSNIFSNGFIGAFFKAARTGSGWIPFNLGVQNPQKEGTAYNSSKQPISGYTKDATQGGPPEATDEGFALQYDGVGNYSSTNSGYLWWSNSLVELNRLDIIPRGLNKLDIQNACTCDGCSPSEGYKPNPPTASCDL